ncbi:hypothetical protein LDENG_00230880 [Lucifuga dentata]|nr:hypothetical protein LDENG_00230880 [Lucifuga dentata]
MRKSSKGSKASLKVEPPPAGEAADDVKVKAVNEMMERIKHGVVLRPVKCQDTKRSLGKQSIRLFSQQPAASEEKQQESAMDELKGILETVKRSPSRSSQETGPSLTGKKDNELEVILRRRRNKAGETGSGDEREAQISSSDSLNGRHTSTDLGKNPEGPREPSIPYDLAGPRSSLERQRSGPAPVVQRRKSSDTGNESCMDSWQERMSCGSLSEKATLEPLIINGCMISELEDNQQEAEMCVQSNGVDHAEPSEDTRGAIGTEPVHGSTNSDC